MALIMRGIVSGSSLVSECVLFRNLACQEEEALFSRGPDS
jgi:hypothetical protein